MKVSEFIKENIKSIIIKEFKGIDYLPDNLIDLMKYEIKATARTLIPLYIALLAFAIINKIFIGTGLAHKLEGFGSIPFILSIFGYGCTMAAVFIVTFFVIIQRFYKNLLGDEGYLMNTIPVSTITNITSKLSIAGFWNIISAHAC